jgi:hypothetical protein
MENPYVSTTAMKPVVKSEAEMETEAAVEKMRTKRVSGFTSRKSSQTMRRYANQRNVFSK